MNARARHTVLGVSLAGALALAWWSWRPAPPPAIAAVPPSAPAPTLNAPAVLAELRQFLSAYRASRAAAPQTARFEPVRDLFVVPEFARAAAPSATTRPAEPAPSRPPPRSLEGVILGPSPLAVIDGRLLRIHDVLDGWELIEVKRGAAVVRDAECGTVLTLELPKAGRRERR